MRTAARTRLVLTVALTATIGCSKGCSKRENAASAPTDTATPRVNEAALATTPVGLSEEEGRALVKGACLSCHSAEILEQQRLTEAQWTKTVTKMIGWGANLEPKDTAPLTAWLAATYGVDAGPYVPARIDVAAAAAEIAPLPDGPFSGGDAERGRALYTDRCSGCHGPQARGHIGTILVDRPFLYRPADFAETVRRGRGKMPAMAMTDAELGDVLAHLRRLN